MNKKWFIDYLSNDEKHIDSCGSFPSLAEAEDYAKKMNLKKAEFYCI